VQCVLLGLNEYEPHQSSQAVPRAQRPGPDTGA
jgi:hypothetical protein